MKSWQKIPALIFVFYSPIIFGEEQPLELNGLLRNDAYVLKTSTPEDYRFYEILENRLIMEAKRRDWKFYTDGRLYIYGGEAVPLYGDYRTDLMRSFVRYFSSIGDFTAGKTYINFGNPGVFNPFEFDKDIDFSDIQYARQGILALEYYLPWQSMGGLKTYIGTSSPREIMWGISPMVHVGTFQVGLVHNHSGPDDNVSGVFFKGDLLVGVQGSWAVHSDDRYSYDYSEASGGIDYSFFDGNLFFSALYYYNEAGGYRPSKYLTSASGFLLAQHYLFTALQWIIDEFWNMQLAAFVNISDQSAVIIPSSTFILTGGLSLSLQLTFFTANGNEEFSRKRTGDFATLLRVEGRY